uniref:MATH domain-containing protein n=1 Tax=Cacopsylla melanoneura TaxID=428564 RepID=A0A8D8Y9X4_9HEMI
MDKERIKVKQTLEKENVIEDQDEKSDLAEHPDCETDLAKHTDCERDLAKSQSDDKEGLKREQIDEKGECSNTNNDSKEIEPTISGKINTCTEVMETFSENILKSLLALIRISRISALEIFKALKTELFKKYFNFLTDETYFSQSCEPRQVRQGNCEVGKVQYVKTSIMTFTMEGKDDQDKTFVSKEEHLFGDFKWKILTKIGQSNDNCLYTMDLVCASDSQKDWECTVGCQLKWISHNPNHNHVVLPNINSYSTLTFTKDKPCVKIGKLERCYGQGWNLLSYEDWKNAFTQGNLWKRTFELVFKSLHKKHN